MGYFIQDAVPAYRPKTAYRGFSGICSGRRYYSVALGRWISRDPAEEESFRMVNAEEGKSNVGNMYVYVGNSSISTIDPKGLTYDFGTWYFTIPKSSVVSASELSQIASETTRLLKKFDMTIVIHGGRTAADKTPQSLTHPFSYNLLDPNHTSSDVHGGLKYLVSSDVAAIDGSSVGKAKKVIHFWNTAPSDYKSATGFSGRFTTTGIYGNRVAVFMQSALRGQPTKTAKTIFHELVKHVLLEIPGDSSQAWDLRGLLMNQPQDATEKIVFETQCDLREKNVYVTSDKVFKRGEE